MTLAVTHRRVSMGDVDQVLAFFRRYFSWMDDGRCELLALLGHPLRDLLADGHGLPVVNASCRYVRPVGLDDLLRIETAVLAVRRTSFDIGHVMTLDGDVVAQGRTTHVWVARKPELHPRPVPGWLADAVTVPAGYDPAPSQ